MLGSFVVNIAVEGFELIYLFEINVNVVFFETSVIGAFGGAYFNKHFIDNIFFNDFLSFYFSSGLVKPQTGLKNDCSSLIVSLIFSSI